MADPQEPGSDQPPSIESVMNEPSREGWCSFFGGHVRNGDRICYFGEEYICQAPNLVKTGNAC
jgi:hypothetical protein